uniref:Photosystem I assembly protein Ycf37 n=1 Tax=Chondria sp. (in: red algae) TaxID=1982705 RepID=A0A1Z1ME42_9FLOR|nr:hypothetical protein [Chondria sp. (in: red algae)]
MDHNIILFRLYIIIALCFLIPLSLLVSIQLYSLFKSYALTYFLLNFFLNNNKVNCNNKDYDTLFILLLKQQRFFLCISSVEYLLSLRYSELDPLYMLLAYCYQNHNFCYVAEYYYLKALSCSPNNEIILSKLTQVSSKLSKHPKLYTNDGLIL